MLRSTLFVAVITLFSFCAATQAAEPGPVTQPSTRPAKKTITVAILDFDANFPGNADLGKQIAETLSATLSGEDGITLVDRASLAKTIAEQEVNLTGLVAQDRAIKIGNLIGAKILIMGRAFTMDKSLMITAKLVGTETSLVHPVMVKDKAGADTADLVMKLSEKVGAGLQEQAPKLIASDDAGVDPMVQLKADLVGKKKPVVSLEIAEQHISTTHVIDPPVDTELRKMLVDCGFTVIDNAEVKSDKAGVGLIIKGEAISEFAARIGNINTCTGRVEIKLVSVGDGKTLLADRETARAADLSENIAAKSSLQKSARLIGLRVLQHLADTLPAK